MLGFVHDVRPSKLCQTPPSGAFRQATGPPGHSAPAHPTGSQRMWRSPAPGLRWQVPRRGRQARKRSEEHTSELQSLMRISYAVFCLKKKKREQITTRTNSNIKTKTETGTS